MISVHNKALAETITVERILGKVKGTTNGPTVVFFGGVHGNETSGVFALNEVFKKLDANQVRGKVYGISGNLKALQAHIRFHDKDLNRLWTKDQIKKTKEKFILNTEEVEQLALLQLLSSIIESHSGSFYFVDLHSTSSDTLPFITINDALINRRFSKQFPVPIVLGIEEYLNGALLSYINQLGYVSLGFESGQHDAADAVNNSIAFVYLTLVYSGVLNEEALPKFPIYYKQLEDQAQKTFDFFEIVYLHSIHSKDNFKMHNGFKSFQDIKKGTALAVNNGVVLKSEYNAKIFMPLYQNKGVDGYFIIMRIKPIFLTISALLRRLKMDGLLILLPGISWLDKKEGILKVNLNIARFFAKSIFHVLGYRSKQITGNYLQLNNRERVAKTAMYKKAWWYKN
ncbi:succinylglutamate desuccinylase/aspartoacylase family protein [Snuella sedimenti]|uniref:Succinylglutamate desuccinylase/aspartoacylase family protein n=1 Tax=Snuella sedimenti TaxID=2798802 RepID=A0A8J7IPA8_9FLAO|nr:succinylglutamate desuccinylase/aspartoacylase family protein [Snuella sedimenti]MBJ6368427.1 succinylglutamate desuccinylase/aspartoacylase family protein [Snuella sedimenti]